ADGGTRTAAITGGFVALYIAIKRMREARMISVLPIKRYIAAVSCGIVDGEARLDLDYAEDFLAGTDLNCVMGDDGRMIEVQATAEGDPYSREELDAMLELANRGIRQLMLEQKKVLTA
ncbi:MAG TPA: ribonuclease PH, partial [Solirubrobacterales bacterium]|nr:ribonuclease PH [Solirubrobacterales bacterium]